jgi:opacity protein-like surface antigen
MRKITVSLLAAAASATLWASPVAAQAKANPPALRDGSHDMDFNFGTWHTEIDRVPDPFGNPSNVVHLAGTVTVKPIWNGKGELEEIEAESPNGHWEGANLFLYDPTARQWIQTYVDSSEGRFDEPSGIGEYRDGNVEYYSAAKVQGRAVLDRAIWSDIKPDSHTYQESFSEDGGRTWHPAFTAHLTRIKK